MNTYFLTYLQLRNFLAQKILGAFQRDQYRLHPSVKVLQEKFQRYQPWRYNISLVSYYSMQNTQWRRDVVVVTTVQLHSLQSELRFCKGSNLRWLISLTIVPARKKVKRPSLVNHTTKTIYLYHHAAFLWSIILQKQFIITIMSVNC